MKSEQTQTDPDVVLYGDLCRELALARRMTAKLTTRDGHYPGNLGTVANALSRARTAVDRLLESDRRAAEMPADPEPRSRVFSAPSDSPADYVEAVPARAEAVRLLQKRSPLSAREILDEMRLRLDAPINGQGVGSVLRGLAERKIVRQVQDGAIRKWEINQ